jgi:hypothetical protein
MAANSVLVQLAQIKAENSQFNMAFQKMEKQVKSTNQVLKGQAAVFGSIMKTFGAGLSVGLVIAGIKNLANDMAVLKNRAEEANMSIQGIQVLDYIARNNSTSLEVLVAMQGKLNTKLAEANSKAGEGNNPHTDHMTDDGFVKWYDQKNFGTKRGSFGLSQQTNGKAMNYDDFVQTLKNSKIQGE